MAEGYDTQINGRLRSFQEQQEELQIIFDSIPAWIFYKDKENRFLKVNKAFCDGMAVSREELEGRSVSELYPREQAEAFWKDDKEVMASGQPKRNILEPVTLPNKETRWLRTDKIPYRDAHGDVIGIIGFSIDVTARKQAEDALRAAYAEEKRLCHVNEQIVVQLRDALAQIRTLNSLLPVCAQCKKICDENGQWHYMETYISTRTDTQFTHGLCPDCAKAAMREAGMNYDGTDYDGTEL